MRRLGLPEWERCAWADLHARWRADVSWWHLASDDRRTVVTIVLATLQVRTQRSNVVSLIGVAIVYGRHAAAVEGSAHATNSR